MIEGYSWEETYKRSWDALADDVSLETLALSSKRSSRKKTQLVHRGIIRYVMIVIDLSSHSESTDWRPSAAEVALKQAKTFCIEFFDQNPLSLLSICILRDGVATPISFFSSNPTLHVQALETKANRTPSGEASLQNGLLFALNSLSTVPSHGTKQVVMFYSALTTCDPGNIFDTISLVSKQKIQVHIVGLTAQLAICKKISTETNGSYQIPVNEAHLEEMVHELVQPPPIKSMELKTEFILMGFPECQSFEASIYCACHSNQTFEAFECPRCKSFACSVPTDCSICGLSLVSSALLARSYHHLFPVPAFQDVQGVVDCYSCNIESKDSLKCPKCSQSFCTDCDAFIHDILFNCPGCLNLE